jgi:hypothetical protein
MMKGRGGRKDEGERIKDERRPETRKQRTESGGRDTMVVVLNPRYSWGEGSRAGGRAENRKRKSRSPEILHCVQNDSAVVLAGARKKG